MRAQIESDWHLEFYEDGGAELLSEICDQPGGEVLFLVGDVLPAQFLNPIDDWLTRVCGAFQYVVYVPGNHEFWGTVPEETWSLLKTVASWHPNLRIPRNELIEIEGRRIYAGTMWFPEGEPWYYGRLGEAMPDFEHIEHFVPWVYEEHARFVAGLEAVQKGDIVLTHHLPSPMSIPNRYIHSPINRFFMVNMEKQILAQRPSLWVHGHTHMAFRYRIGGTRVVCNPMGYPNYERGKNGYRPNQIVEI